MKITCRLECISAAAKWSPGRQMRPIKRSGLFHVLQCVGATTTSNYKAVPVGPFDRLIVFRWCTNGYGMMHKVWSSIGEVPYCFSKSSVKFQGHTGQEIADLYSNWVFPDCNSSLNSPMDLKWCTKLDTVLKRCPILFSKAIHQISMSHGTQYRQFWLELSVSEL